MCCMLGHPLCPPGYWWSWKWQCSNTSLQWIKGARVLTQHRSMMFYQMFQLVFSQYMTSCMLSHGRRVCYAWSLHKRALVLGYNKRKNTIRWYFFDIKAHFWWFLKYLQLLLPFSAKFLVPTVSHSLRNTFFKGFVYSPWRYKVFWRGSELSQSSRNSHHGFLHTAKWTPGLQADKKIWNFMKPSVLNFGSISATEWPLCI